MTAYGFAASVVWAAAVLLIAWRAERLLLTYRGGDVPPAHEPVVLPPDLAAFVAAFTSEWARADAKKAVLERYEQSHDWNTVRRAVGVGVMN